ncbi:MAG: FtsX-like permease family protein, partial [Acidimicrobiales bacterium]
AAQLPAPAVSGVRMALEAGRGRSAVPARSTMTSAVLGVATITGVLCFSASLGKLFDDPRQYGWNWDVQVGDSFAPALGADAQELIDHEEVAAASIGTIARLQIGTVRVDALASDPVRGTIQPTILQGRAPSQATEIVLGTRTMKDLGANLGTTVTVTAGDRTADMQVVGRGVFSEFSGASRLGDGGAVTLDGLRRLVPEAAPDLVLLRLAPTPGGQALLDDLLETRPANIYVPSQPTDLADLGRVGALPSVVALIITVMAVATLAHTLVTSVRRRRRELAVLKVLGFTRSQISATVVWQSTTVATVAVVGGLPLGIAAGRWGWQLFAGQLGVPPQPATPALAMVALAAATILLANLVAAVPARLAARTQPSLILRAE